MVETGKHNSGVTRRMAGKKASEIEYMATVGHLVNNSAMIDILLNATLQAFTKMDLKLTKAILYSVDALQTKQNILRRVLKTIPHDEEDQRLLDAILVAADSVQNQRNEVSHSVYNMPTSGGTARRTRMRDLRQSSRPVTLRYLNTLLTQSTAALFTAAETYQELCRKRGVQPVVGTEPDFRDSQASSRR